ncbi:hypothetical protein [Caballeronia sp. GaOx3]|uniref:hypothetical protein n=1 Tax=Caballeronia sp. GaOx3 TaxID=2921740 RepID=UPI0020287E4C|nr:hypothetical protein [Caballeronia sp. GaOx3]
MASTLNSSVYCRYGTSFSDIRTSVQTEISKFLLYVKSRHGQGRVAQYPHTEARRQAVAPAVDQKLLSPEWEELLPVNVLRIQAVLMSHEGAPYTLRAVRLQILIYLILGKREFLRT